MEHDILVMMADDLLQIREIEAGVVDNSAIVKPQEESLELRDDGVFIVPGVADQRPPLGGASVDELLVYCS